MNVLLKMSVCYFSVRRRDAKLHPESGMCGGLASPAVWQVLVKDPLSRALPGNPLACDLG